MIAFYLSVLERPEDEAAFTAFYDAHLPTLTRVGRVYFHESWLIQDALQETWIRIAKNFAKITALPCHESRYYIVTIMKNCCKTLLQKEKPYLELFPDEDAMLGDVTSIEVQEKEGHGYLVSLIATMPKLYREVLERKLVMEETNQEIARTMRISNNLVAQRLVRGKKLLVEALRKEGAYIDWNGLG